MQFPPVFTSREFCVQPGTMYGGKTMQGFHRSIDWSCPPQGGRFKQVIVGLVLPLVIAYFCYGDWFSEEVVWTSGKSRGVRIVVTGIAAKCAVIAPLSIASFIHFRWFWGALGFYRTFQVGMIISLLVFIGSMVCGVYHIVT